MHAQMEDIRLQSIHEFGRSKDMRIDEGFTCL